MPHREGQGLMAQGRPGTALWLLVILHPQRSGELTGEINRLEDDTENSTESEDWQGCTGAQLPGACPEPIRVHSSVLEDGGNPLASSQAGIAVGSLIGPQGPGTLRQRDLGVSQDSSVIRAHALYCLCTR